MPPQLQLLEGVRVEYRRRLGIAAEGHELIVSTECDRVDLVFAWANAALGAIPVRRGEADRQAMKAAQTIIADGAMMIVFPEGTRQSGDQVLGVFDGTTYLAHKTGAPIIPIGIGGTEAAMASGSKGIRRVRCSVVVGEPIAAPEGRLSQPQRHAFSENVSAELQKVFDRAISMAAD